MSDNNMQIISECCELLGNAVDPVKTLQNLCRYLTEAFEADVAVIWGWDTQESRFAMRAYHGLYVDEISTLTNDNSLNCAVVRTRQVLNTVLKENVDIAGVTISNVVIRRYGSALVLPLRMGGTVIGTLSLARRQRVKFPAATVEACRVLGMTLAGFLQNNELNRTQALQNDVSKTPLNASALTTLAAGLNVNPGQAFSTGTPIVPGVCCGHCMKLAGDDALKTVRITKTNDADTQLKRLNRAYDSTRLSITKVSKEIGELIAEADDGIFDMYLILLDDPTLRQRITDFINDGYNLESALALTGKVFQKEFLAIEDDYLRERFQDVEDILLRLLTVASNVSGSNVKTADATGPIVLVAKELFPSQLVSTPLKQVSGIVCESGGSTSHAAILARALHIPMLVGIKGIQQTVKSGEKLLLDCDAGICYQNPAPALMKRYRAQTTATRRLRCALSKPAAPADDMPTTTDGIPIKLCGNVTLFSELPMLHAAGIREIGLYRTEFMFLIRPNMPDEQTQYHVLRNLINNSRGAPVTIRTLDVGGDKPLPYCSAYFRILHS